MKIGFPDYKKSSERGDTIVEVMMALIVIASIITGAFLVARTSTQNIRSSEEHAQALQFLQGQVELARASSNNGAMRSPPAKFCMSGTAPVAATNAACTKDSLYVLSGEVVSAPADASSTTTYVFTVVWPGLNGTDSQEQIYYRVKAS